MNTPILTLVLASIVGQDASFWSQPENIVITAMIGGSVTIYAISKLDTIKSMFGYFLILLVVCVVVMVMPVFGGTGVETYAEQTLTLLNELLKSLIKWVNTQSIDAGYPNLLAGGRFC